MITLSNGCFSNSINPSTIAEIAKSARKSAEVELTGHDGQIEHSLGMGLVERFVDLVFCGGVKYEYMHCLFDLTKKRALMEASLRTASNHPEAPAYDRRLIELQNAVNRSRRQINGLMPGKVLEFANSNTQEFYLVYRDAGSLVAIGIPVMLQPPLSSATLNAGLVTSLPKFNTIGDMRSGDLADIQKSGQFDCGGQRYTVRFTALNEPIVMWSGSGNQSSNIQQRLQNLWLLRTLQREFSEMDSVTGAKRTALKLTSLTLPDIFADPEAVVDIQVRFSDDAEWVQCGIMVREKFKTMVNFLHGSLDAEILAIAKQLQFFETLTNPTRDQIHELQLFGARIALFRQRQNDILMKINTIQRKLNNIFELIQRGNDIELAGVFRTRLINFTDQMLSFAQSGMDDAAFDAFKALCEIQNVFFSSFKPDQALRREFDPAREWTHREIHPPVLPPEEIESLFSLVKNPANSREVVRATIEELNEFKRKCFDLKNRQIALAHEYEQLLISGLLNEHPVEFCKLNISQKFNIDVARLREIIDACLIPGNQFSEQELDDIQREAKSIWYALWNEHENWMYRLRISKKEVHAS